MHFGLLKRAADVILSDQLLATGMSTDLELRSRAQKLGLRDPVLDLDLLKVFLCAIESGSLTAAARSLDRTQSAVSLQIKRLEEFAGAAVLHRAHGRLALTDTGRTLQRYARGMLQLNAEAISALRPDVLSGCIRIGAIDHVATETLPPLIAEFRAAHPEVRVEVETGVTHHWKDRLNGDLDLLISLYPHGARVSGAVLQHDKVVWVTALRNSPHRRFPLPVALGVAGGVLRRLAIEQLQASARLWHPAYETTNTAALEAAVSQGLAVGVCRQRNIAKGMRQLTAKDGFASLADVMVVLDTATSPLPRHVAAFRDLLLRHHPGRRSTNGE